MDKVSLFSSLLATDKLSVDNLSLEMFAYEQMRMTDGRKYTNRGGWQSNFIDDLPQVQPLIEQINQRLEQLRDDVKFIDQAFLRVESMWININHPYSYNSNHIHPNSYISGVYYVKVPENSGNLVLRHPSNLISIFTPSDVIKQFNTMNSSKWNIIPNDGDLVMFPSWIEHEVTQNISGEDRISFAFNTSFFAKK
jgi:uncharacterized protein (TIGR02466 family)